MAAAAPPGIPGRRRGGPVRRPSRAPRLRSSTLHGRSPVGARVPVRSGVKKILYAWGFWIFVAFYVVTAPSDAASFVHTAFGWLGQLGDGFSNFVSDVAV